MLHTDSKIRILSELCKTAVIFLLVVLMFVQLILLLSFSGRQKDTLSSADKRMLVYENDTQTGYATGMNTALVIPSALAWRTETGAQMYCLENTTTVQAAYETLYPVIRTAFSEQYEVSDSGETDAQTLWEQCVCGELPFVYVCFRGELPLSVIRAYTYSSLDVESQTDALSLDAYPAGDTVYARELFFLPQTDTDSFRVLIRDAAGKVALCGSRGEASADDVSLADFFAYTEKDDTTSEAFFYASDDVKTIFEESGCLLMPEKDTALFPLRENTAGGVFIGRYDSTARLFADTEESRTRLLTLLSVFGIDNKTTDDFYTAPENQRVYLNADGRLTIGVDGTLSYIALQNGGLSVGGFLGYRSIDNRYSLSEYLRASDSLLSAIAACDGGLCGGDADLVLTGVYSEETGASSVLVFSYRLSYHGTAVYYGGADKTVCTVTMADGYILSVLLDTPDIEGTQQTTVLLPPRLVLSAITYEEYEETEQTSCQGTLVLYYEASVPAAETGTDTCIFPSRCFVAEKSFTGEEADAE